MADRDEYYGGDTPDGAEIVDPSNPSRVLR
jgi:hypothetical protein